MNGWVIMSPAPKKQMLLFRPTPEEIVIETARECDMCHKELRKAWASGDGERIDKARKRYEEADGCHRSAILMRGMVELRER